MSDNKTNKQLVLDFIAANPALASKNKAIHEGLKAQGHDIKVEAIAAIKSQNKAKEIPEKKFDMSSFKQVFAMQKRLNDAGGITAVEAALLVVEPLLSEVDSLDTLKMILSVLKEVTPETKSDSNESEQSEAA